MASSSTLARRREKLDETAPQRDNPFKNMTLEEAKADKPMWDTFTLTVNAEGALTIVMKLESEIFLPKGILDDVKGDKAGQVAKMHAERLQLDMQELEMFLKHKLSEFLNAA